MAISGSEVRGVGSKVNNPYPTSNAPATSESIGVTTALAVTDTARDNNQAQRLMRPYCTIADVKAYIKNHTLDTAVYTLAINLASRAIDKWCERDFWYREETYRLQDDEITEEGLYLRWAIRELTQVRVNNEVQSQDSYYFVPITADPFGPNSFIKNLSMRLYNTNVQDGAIVNQANRIGFAKEVKVTGKFGYSILDESRMPIDEYFPSAVRRACSIIAGAFTNHNRREEVGVDGQRQSLLSTEIPDEVKKLLKKYKRIRL